MLRPEDLNIALEAMEDENEIDLEEAEKKDDESDESNDSVDESVPDDKQEGEEDESNDESEEPEESKPEDTSSEEGGDSTGSGGGEEGGEEPAEGGGEESPGDAEEESADDAKKELLDKTPMPETDPVEESVEIKDGDDGDSAAASPKEVALDMEEVGSLEKMLDMLDAPLAPVELKTKMGKLYTNLIRMTHGLESFGLDKDFACHGESDVDVLRTTLRTVIDKSKTA